MTNSHFPVDGFEIDAVYQRLHGDVRLWDQEEQELSEDVPMLPTYEQQVRRSLEIRGRREQAVPLAAKLVFEVTDYYESRGADLDGEWTSLRETLNDIWCGGNYPDTPFSRPFNLRDLGWQPTWKPPAADCPYRRQSVLDVEAKFAGGRVLTEEMLLEYGLTIRDISREHLLAMVDREMFVPREAYQPIHLVGGSRFWLCGVATHADGRPWGVNPVRWARTAHEGRARA